MPTLQTPPTIRLSTARPDECGTDIVFVPCFEDDDLRDVPGLELATGGELARARERGALRGKAYELLITPVAGSKWKAGRIGLIGAGTRESASPERWRRLATAAGLAARQCRTARFGLLYRSAANVDPAEALQAMAEGACLANFDGGSYKTGKSPRFFLDTVDLIMGEAPPAGQARLERGCILGEYTNVARALSNEPGNTLPPRELASRAVDIAAGTGLAVEILDEHRIRELGMGLLLGVGQGSVEPPRLIVMKHDPPGAPTGPVLGLVGKGVTFDTGGISIKPADNMEKMKDDMSGGAAVIAAMAALSRLDAPIRVVGIVPAAENMPGGRAIRPGDVLRGAGGTTVEVINTDAEGRLVLADGLWYARQLGATHLVDVATLTGACVVALGTTTSGLFGTPESWLDDVRRATERAGDRSWALPTFEDYGEQLKSDIADIKNTGGRPAGAITAALFLKEFAGALPWVHMDIAGTCWADEAKPYQQKGATGVAVRTLVELALQADAWDHRP